MYTSGYGEHGNGAWIKDGRLHMALHLYCMIPSGIMNTNNYIILDDVWEFDVIFHCSRCA